MGSNCESGLLLPEFAFGDNPVVTVSVNYRLGALGFLHLPGQNSTNRALLDIIQALQYVRDEIASFGGDPQNVTVYGQSSGAVNAAALLASPLAKGLFHKVVLSSGGVNDLQQENWAVASNDLYASLRGVKGLEWDDATGEPLIESLGNANLEQLIAVTAKVRREWASV
jgi:para-nitrobenzyl esterase